MRRRCRVSRYCNNVNFLSSARLSRSLSRSTTTARSCSASMTPRITRKTNPLMLVDSPREVLAGMVTGTLCAIINAVSGLPSPLAKSQRAPRQVGLVFLIHPNSAMPRATLNRSHLAWHDPPRRGKSARVFKIVNDVGGTVPFTMLGTRRIFDFIRKSIEREGRTLAFWALFGTVGVYHVLSGSCSSRRRQFEGRPLPSAVMLAVSMTFPRAPCLPLRA